jgi:hypothetical protein
MWKFCVQRSKFHVCQQEETYGGDDFDAAKRSDEDDQVQVEDTPPTYAFDAQSAGSAERARETGRNYRSISDLPTLEEVKRMPRPVDPVQTASHISKDASNALKSQIKFSKVIIIIYDYH